MKSLSRIPGWWLAIVCAAAAMVGISERALASGAAEVARPAFTYTVTAPVSGYQLIAGSTIVITWTSSNPSSNVNISLVDVNAWAVEEIVATNVSDTGSYTWTIPSNVPAGDYLIYIEDVGVTDWTYGSTFQILECGSALRQQRARPEVRIDRSRPMDRMRPAPRN